MNFLDLVDELQLNLSDSMRKTLKRHAVAFLNARDGLSGEATELYYNYYVNIDQEYLQKMNRSMDEQLNSAIFRNFIFPLETKIDDCAALYYDLSQIDLNEFPLEIMNQYLILSMMSFSKTFELEKDMNQYVVVFGCADATFANVWKTMLSSFFFLLMDCYPAKLHRIFFVEPSFIVKTVIQCNIVFSQERARIFSVVETMTDLDDFLDIVEDENKLITELGGKLGESQFINDWPSQVIKDAQLNLFGERNDRANLQISNPNASPESMRNDLGTTLNIGANKSSQGHQNVPGVIQPARKIEEAKIPEAFAAQLDPEKISQELRAKRASVSSQKLDISSLLASKPENEVMKPIRRASQSSNRDFRKSLNERPNSVPSHALNSEALTNARGEKPKPAGDIKKSESVFDPISDNSIYYDPEAPSFNEIINKVIESAEFLKDEKLEIDRLEADKDDVQVSQKFVSTHRYKSFGPIHDSNRVKVDDGTDPFMYYNASYVLGPSGDRKFICAESPSSENVSKFIKMIWDENISVCVLLSNIEQRNKCENYLPQRDKPDASKTFIHISIKDLENAKKIRESALNVVLQTMNASKHESNASGSTGPILLHCSTGLRLSCILIGMDIAKSLRVNSKGINFKKIAIEIRKQRPHAFPGQFKLQDYSCLYSRALHSSVQERRDIFFTNLEGVNKN